MNCAGQGGNTIDVDFRICNRLFTLEGHNTKRPVFQLRISEYDTYKAGIKNAD
jgi:hypothetical protein